MLISCDQLGKRYNRHWVFRNFSRNFQPGEAVGIVGNNGSGKSTLLKVLAGYERFSEGTFSVTVDGKKIDENSVYKFVSLCAPYQALYEDLSVKEHFDLHSGFKKLNIENFQAFEDLLALENAQNKSLKNFSSGMRQRVKLALAVLSDTPALFLDEPVSNLDARSTQWYKDLVSAHLNDRMVFVASNRNEDELFCCKAIVDIETLK